MTESRFSPPVAHLRALAATRPFERIIDDARALLPAAEANPDVDLPALLILIGNALTSQGECTDAVRHLTRAHDAAVRIGDRALEAEAAAGIGAAFLGTDDQSAALLHFERAEKIATECGHHRLRGNVLRRIGVSFSILGRHAQAMDQLIEAGAVLADVEDAELDRLQLVNSTLNARSRELEGAPTDKRDAAAQAAAHAALLPEWLRLAADARRGGMERVELMALGNYAITARSAGQIDESIRVLRELVPRYDALGMRPNVVISWNHLGYAFEQTADWPAARQAFEEALKLLGEGGSVRERRDAYDGVARACEHIGDAWAALAAVKAARAIDAQMDDEEARRLAAQRQDRAELAKLTARWERLAEQDPLTGLNNRRALETWLDGKDPQQLFSLLLLDLDHFKDINDRFGHSAGDRALIDVARLLRDNCRAQDIPVRYGGEEFVVALPGTGADEAQAIAERIRSEIEARDWSGVAQGLDVTTSIGCASSHEGGDAQAVFALADTRLYAAKRAGRNRVHAS